MSDNVTFQSDQLATPPKDFIVATDEVDGVDYQKIKLVTGEDGEVYAVTHANPLPFVDNVLRDFMEQILSQLKILNTHLSILTSEEINKEDTL